MSKIGLTVPPMLIWLLTYNKAITILGGTVFEFLTKVNNSRNHIFFIFLV